MTLQTILALMGAVLLATSAQAQAPAPPRDELILEMQQAFR